jgi:hypothetical protein
VLYQLSYCGEPLRRIGYGPKTPARDIGHGPILQEKAGGASARTASLTRLSETNRSTIGSKSAGLTAPAGQEAAPAAGLAL